MKNTPVIAVVGSLNVDYVFRVQHLPRPGETVSARGAETFFGGKGANQAVAAARAGGTVRLIGCVGTDADGLRYRARLEQEAIDVRGLFAAPADVPTGSAFIAVDDAGENTIIVHPGANHALTPATIDDAAFLIRDADALLLQLECPLPTVCRAVEIARQAGVPVLFNPSPWMDSVRTNRFPVDVLIVNETEAGALLGYDIATPTTRPAEILAAAACRTLVVTRGGDPTLAFAENQRWEAPPPRVTPVDTVGAGDTFAGAFAVALAGGMNLPASMEFANAAAALATLKAGAQTAMPNRAEILKGPA